MFHIWDLPQAVRDTLQNRGANNIHVDNYAGNGAAITGNFTITNEHFNNEHLNFVIHPLANHEDEYVLFTISNEDGETLAETDGLVSPSSVCDLLTEYISNPQLAIANGHFTEGGDFVEVSDDEAEQNLNQIDNNLNQNNGI